MEFLFKSRFNSLMEGISGQFGTTPLGVVIFLLSIIALPTVLFLVYRAQQRRSRRKNLERSREIIGKKTAALGLSPAESDLVNRLAETVEDGKNGYLVLFDEARFHKAAARLREKDPEVTTGALASLQVKLGFQREPARAPHSTAMIPEGRTLLMRPEKHGGVFRVKISRIQGDGFEISSEGSHLLAAGDSALFQYQNSQGTFLFKSYCLKRAGNRMLMRHQDRFKKMQKRAYFRAPFDGPLTVGYFEKEERFTSRFADLGGGGASFVNPDERFGEGDFLELNFSLPGASREFNLRGEVIRTSRGNKLLHLQFQGITEPQRDRIIGSLFKSREESE